ncbi:hypothetical protein [Allostreptomyces psammosilenae]|uniref:Ribosomal protein L37AE/L43A n=1 Tax=Allostreptomyces psammosilenae TaxID=1892865 RepID=A0A852ZP78_9ACTN|nr:hypothetical protein [Allostreptomyces psammosilenae]NYI03267.1 ribosomal protein L37AE/L43A [Allostreptomyces psammosilenae]
MSGAEGATRAVPFYCPFCGEEDLRPSEAGHGAWECGDCARAFRLSFLGLVARGAAAHRGATPAGAETDHREDREEGTTT